MAHNEPYKDGLLDQNTYYHAKNITAFPASNGVDVGKVFTEENGRNITINITDMNYAVSPNPGAYSISFVNNQVEIQPGKAIINGFEVLTNEVIHYRLPNNNELYTGTKYNHKYDGFALLCLHTIFDSMNNLSGNVQVDNEWYFEGIHVCYATAEEYESKENEYLLLGGVKPDGTIKPNDELFTRINAKYILVRLFPDPETGVPPLQSTNLLEFINNYLHGYWVSKAGDHEYGNLTFRKKPNAYLNPLFDYNDEEPLANDVYAIKIAREGIDSAANDNPTYQEGWLSVKHSDNKDFVGYEKSSKIVPLGTFYKDNIKDASNNYNVFVGYTTQDNTHPSYKENSDNNTFLSRITNYAHLKGVVGEDFLNTGKSVDTGSFIWDSTGFDTNYSQRFKIQFSKDNFYVGAINYSNKIQNDLYSTENSIATRIYDYTNNNHFSIDLSALKQQITFRTKQQTCSIHLREDSEVANAKDWTNVLDISDNAEVTKNLWTHGYIIAGTQKYIQTVDGNRIDISKDPSLIEVPDFYNTEGYRKLKAGDIYTAGQIWSAVYNDYAERFNVLGDDIEPGMIVAINKFGIYEIADRNKHKNVVGVISQNPAMCVGGNGDYPIALAGRVNVYYIGKKPKIGQYVGLSKKIPGYASVCHSWSKYKCGIVTQIINDGMVEILIK